LYRGKKFTRKTQQDDYGGKSTVTDKSLPNGAGRIKRGGNRNKVGEGVEEGTREKNCLGK